MITSLKTLLKQTLHLLGNTRFNQERLRDKLGDFDRINVGCGVDPGSGIDGWLNIGLFSQRRLLYGTLKHEGERAMLHFDMTKGLPLPDNTAQYVYSSHFIEHLSLERGREFFKRCYRVMQPGGIIRTTTPDLEIWIRNYYEDKTDFFEQFYSMLQSYSGLNTKGQILVGQIQGWGHRWLYDFDSLKDVMSQAGFTSFAKKQYHESAIPGIETFEPGGEGRILESLYVEAQKPDD